MRDSSKDRITVYIKGYGEYGTTPRGLDRAIGEYLPASAQALREIVEYRAGHEFTEVYDVSTFLVVLADFDDAAEQTEQNIRKQQMGQRICPTCGGDLDDDLLQGCCRVALGTTEFHAIKQEDNNQ